MRTRETQLRSKWGGKEGGACDSVKHPAAEILVTRREGLGGEQSLAVGVVVLDRGARARHRNGSEAAVRAVRVLTVHPELHGALRDARVVQVRRGVAALLARPGQPEDETVRLEVTLAVVVPGQVACRLVLLQQRQHVVDDLLRGTVAALRVDRVVRGHPQVLGLRLAQLLLQPRELRVPELHVRRAKALHELTRRLNVFAHARKHVRVDVDDLSAHSLPRLSGEALRERVVQGRELPAAGQGDLRVVDLRRHVPAVVVVAGHSVPGHLQLRVREHVLERLLEALRVVRALNPLLVEVVAHGQHEPDVSEGGCNRAHALVVRQLAGSRRILVAAATPVAKGKEGKAAVRRSCCSKKRRETKGAHCREGVRVCVNEVQIL
eukprot:Rhum_TRINITY_DN14705_c11_g3::Rhum_TRINITY_DN14705_c11_g3_i1::g.112265::m.112265